MKSISLLLLLASSTAFGQYQFSNPIELTGTEEGARTIHFTNDGSAIYGDWDELTQWNLRSKSIVDSKEIAGYNTHQSAFDGYGVWVNGNVNYNTEKKDITDTHNNLNIISSSANTPNKTERPYGLATFVPETKDVIIVASTPKHTYEVVRLATETFEESTKYFDENKDGAAVPTSIKISEDGKLVAIGLAGEKSGVRICNVKDGSLVKFIPASSDVNDLAFSGNGDFLFFNIGAQLIQLKTSDWTREKAWEFSSPISALDVNSTGKYVAFSFQNAGSIFVDVTNGAILGQLTGQKVSDIAFSDDDQYVAVGIQKTLKTKESPAIVVYAAE